jgi:MFS family permease
METGRIAQAMLPVALVLLALTNFASPALAGAFTFLTVFPGLLAAPFVGALIDRFGKVASIRVDYVAGAVVTALIATLPLASPDVVPLLLGLSVVLGVSQLFSDAGFRSLFVDLVPSHLLERVNAVDSSGYQVALIAGPPIAATVFALAGAPMTFLAIAVAYGASAVFTIGLGETRHAPAARQPLLRSAVEGIAYVWGNATLRGMAISVSVTGVALGIATIVVPVLIVEQLRADEALVGVAFAVAGLCGVAGAVVIGRLDTRGHERMLIVAAHGVMTFAALLLLPATAAGVVAGMAWILVSMVVRGAGESAWDLGVFALRQRRTERHMHGRAFTISMALNYSGVPIGAALGGWLAATDVALALWVAVAFGTAGTLLTYLLLPRERGAVGREPVEDPHEATARHN